MPEPGLRHFIRVYDADLDAPMCRQIVESFESLSRFHRTNGRGRAGFDHSAWTELNMTQLSDAAFLQFFRRKMNAALVRYNADVALPVAIPNSPESSALMIKRYRPTADEKFETHFDSIYDVSNRYLVFLWYLNDVAEGGETLFPSLDLRVQPRAGRLLMFPPYWPYPHAGLAPVSGDKYILSTYLLFGDRPGGVKSAE